MNFYFKPAPFYHDGFNGGGGHLGNIMEVF